MDSVSVGVGLVLAALVVPRATGGEHAVSSAAPATALPPCVADAGAVLGECVATDGRVIAVTTRAPLGGTGTICVYEEGAFASVALAPDPPDAAFGAALALDGDTLVAGGSNAYVHRRIHPGVWIADAVIAGPAQALALDGDRLAIGDGQRVRILARDGSGAWSLEEVLLHPSPVFGATLALEGDLLLVGADEAAVLFERRPLGWQLNGELTADRAGTNGFGVDVALWRGVAYVGSYRYGALDRGAVFEFVRGAGGSWQQSARLEPRPGDPFEAFGLALDVGSSGLFVAAPYADVRAAQAAGVVYRFERSPAGPWKLAEVVSPDPRPFGVFGWSVASARDLLVVGAIGADESGAAYCVALD